ncbi:MAG: hypothetical protein ACTSR8_06320 [Promethearchaeota archaeon]
MIREENRTNIKRLIKQYRDETGKQPIIRGQITEQFLNWRKNKEKK